MRGSSHSAGVSTVCFPRLSVCCALPVFVCRPLIAPSRSPPARLAPIAHRAADAAADAAADSHRTDLSLLDSDCDSDIDDDNPTIAQQPHTGNRCSDTTARCCKSTRISVAINIVLTIVVIGQLASSWGWHPRTMQPGQVNSYCTDEGAIAAAAAAASGSAAPSSVAVSSPSRPSLPSSSFCSDPGSVHSNCVFVNLCLSVSDGEWSVPTWPAAAWRGVSLRSRGSLFRDGPRLSACNPTFQPKLMPQRNISETHILRVPGVSVLPCIWVGVFGQETQRTQRAGGRSTTQEAHRREQRWNHLTMCACACVCVLLCFVLPVLRSRVS